MRAIAGKGEGAVFLDAAVGGGEVRDEERDGAIGEAWVFREFAGGADTIWEGAEFEDDERMKFSLWIQAFDCAIDFDFCAAGEKIFSMSRLGRFVFITHGKECAERRGRIHFVCARTCSGDELRRL